MSNPAIRRFQVCVQLKEIKFDTVGIQVNHTVTSDVIEFKVSEHCPTEVPVRALQTLEHALCDKILSLSKEAI